MVTDLLWNHLLSMDFIRITERNNLSHSILLSMGMNFYHCFMCDSLPESGLCGIFNNYPLQTGKETKPPGQEM